MDCRGCLRREIGQLLLMANVTVNAVMMMSKSYEPLTLLLRAAANISSKFHHRLWRIK